MDLVEKIFWSLVIFLGVHFLWLGGLEEYLSLYLGTAISLVAVALFIFLVRNKEDKDG
tara:strand:- start:2843 stop:3016 length:174 start_codon:yes stop_codon:yes gene_type:complete